MSSFAKLLPHPRLQLVVLMTVLGAALLPKNSMAEDEAPVSPDASGSDESPAADKASGRAEGGPPPAKDWIECWSCRAEEDCKKPKRGQIIVDSCEGYCYQDIKDDGSAHRRCAHPSEITCFKDKADKCEKYKPGEKGPIQTCIDEEYKKNNKETPTAAPAQKGRSEEGPSGGMKCICDQKLCNNGTSSGPTGVKQLGYSAALAGALLVSAFPLRKLFLVG